MTTIPEGLRMVSEITALDAHRYEHRETVVTDAADYTEGDEEWSDPAEVEVWRAWVERIHTADCRLAELKIQLGVEAVQAALAGAGITDAEWEHQPGCLEEAIAELESARLEVGQ